MVTYFVNISLDLIEDGRLLVDLNERLKTLAQDLVAHIAEHGPEACEKQSAELDLKVKFTFKGEDGFTITSKLSTKMPGRPVGVSLAFAEDGNILVKKPLLSASDDPKQMTLDDAAELARKRIEERLADKPPKTPPKSGGNNLNKEAS